MKIIYIIYMFLIVVSSLLLSNNTKKTNTTVQTPTYIGLKDNKESTDSKTSIDYINMTSLKYGRIFEKFKVSCELKRNETPFDSYTYKDKDFIVGDIVKSGDILCGNVIKNTGIISGFDNNNFYVDQFNCYTAIGHYFTVNESDLKKINQILKHEEIKAEIDNNEELKCDINVIYNNETNCYDFILTNIIFDYYPSYRNYIYLKYYLGDSCVGYYFEVDYIWPINNDYYVINQDEKLIKLDIIDVIDEYVFVNKNDLSYNDYFIKYKTSMLEYYEKIVKGEK